MNRNYKMNEDALNVFYLPERNQSFTNDKCFLCGIDLDQNNSSDEHIFPKWLQREFNLWDKELRLLADDRVIPYRMLTIPCCKKCNGNYLSQLEQEIGDKYREGYEKFKDIDKFKLFLWMSKIFYGLLFKELFLPLDRKQPHGDKILTQELLEQFRMAHMFLQGVRVKMIFDELNPWSIFIFNSKTAENKDLNFDFRDSFKGLVFGIRMGEISVVAVLQDNGAQAAIFKETIEKLQQLKLHPIQFEEIFAKVSYKQLTLNKVPKYLIIQKNDGTDISVIPQRLGGIFSSNIYDQWDELIYSHILSFHTKVPQEKLYVTTLAKTVTYLYDDDINLKNIDDNIFS